MRHKDARTFLKTWIRAKQTEQDIAKTVLEMQKEGRHGSEFEHQLTRARLYAHETEQDLYACLKGEITP